MLPLVIVAVLALFLRVNSLDKVPPALFGDEIDVGYQAYSISKTGKDIYGRTMPFYIKSLAEYRAPLFIYSAVPFVSTFGLNEWGVRLPAAFWGMVGVIGLFLLTRHLFNGKAAFLSALLLSISPWHLQYSRAGFEATMLLALIIFATYFFLLGMEKRSFLILSFLLFGLTLYVYSTAVLFTPLWVLALLIIFRHKILTLARSAKNRMFLGMAAVTLLIAVFPAAWSVYTGEARERFSVVSIFQDQNILDKINHIRRGQEYLTLEGEKERIDPQKETLFHNKLTAFSQVFSLNYLRAFSPEFLFTRGDPTFRHSIQEMGQLYYFELILIFIGIGVIARVNAWQRIFVLSWLILAPIPASLTSDGGYHATRLFLMLPPLAILGALGAAMIVSRLKERKFKFLGAVIFILVIFNVGFYLHRYYVHYPIESWRWWHVGFKEVLTYVDKNQDKYQRIVINNSYEPSLERFLFYTKYDPARFHREFTLDQVRDNILPGIDGFILDDKIYFGRIGEKAKEDGGLNKVMQPGMLYIASMDEGGDLRRFAAHSYTILKTVTSPVVDPGTPDGQPIFFVLEGK